MRIKKDFKGKTFGIRLFIDEEFFNDRIMFSILINDDDWNLYNETIDYSSSHWILDLIEISTKVKEWLEKYCNVNDSGHGWKFNKEYEKEWN